MLLQNKASTRLSHLQHQFKNFVFNNNTCELINAISSNYLARASIYRNNSFITLSKTLEKTYPALLQIVGEEFFNGLAHHYSNAYPSHSPLIQHFGANFAEFLKHFPPALALPYLPEVAQLEWAMHTAYFAENSDSDVILQLQKVSATHYGKIRFRLNPACRLLRFTFPVQRIWQRCQMREDDNAIVDLAAGGENIMVMRQQGEVVFEKLDEPDYAFLLAIANNNCFAEATSLALITDPTFNITSYLSKRIQDNTLVNFSLTD